MEVLFWIVFVVTFFLPWSQRLSFNIIFFHWKFATGEKPLVATVGNLTFMLAQHLTAVKDVIFFRPITKEDQSYNLLTGPGGSVLRYSEINYFVGRGEKRLLCLQAVKLPGSRFRSWKGQITSLALKMERENINRCSGGLRMEDQGERSPQTFLGNNFSSFNRNRNKTIGALSSVSFESRSGIKAAAWTLENKNGNVQY